MSPYKIGLVLDDSLDKSDGVQQYVITLGKWLEQSGHNVHYLVGESKRQDIPRVHSLSKNVQVHFNQNRMSIPLPAKKSAIDKLLKKEKFDILHVQMPYSPWMAGRIIMLASESTAIIGTFHIVPYSNIESLATRLLAIYLRKSRRRFDQIISVSSVASKFAKKTFRTKSLIIPNGINLTHFHNAKTYAKYNDGKFNIVFLGRLVARKGCMQLLKAIKILHSDGRLDNVRVLICGKGPYQSQLEEFVRVYHLTHHVSFIGYVSEEDKPKYLSCADIAVFPSTGGESFGIVLVEAMAAARGVVLGGDNVGYKTILGSKPNQIFDPNDTKKFAKILRHYLRHAKARKQAHQWQQESVGQYDIKIVGAKIIKIYSEALQTKRGLLHNNP